MKNNRELTATSHHILSTLRPGKVGAILGRSGSGKTAVLRQVVGFGIPQRNERMGYVPQAINYPEHLTPQELLMHTLALHGKTSSADRKQKLATALTNHQLTPFLNQRLSKVTTSAKRQLALAAALIIEPTLLVLDEPFLGLDPIARPLELDHLEEFKSTGGKILLATNDLTNLQSLVDEIWILKDSKLSFDSTSSAADASVFNFRYGLIVTGTKIDDLKQLGSTKNLKPWNMIRHNGYLCTLRFSDYPVASAWLKACLESGLIVTKFGEDLAVDVQDTSPFFEGVSP
jgi:ABC-2 type transport system ATP-binding protein